MKSHNEFDVSTVQVLVWYSDQEIVTTYWMKFSEIFILTIIIIIITTTFISLLPSSSCCYHPSSFIIVNIVFACWLVTEAHVIAFIDALHIDVIIYSSFTLTYRTACSWSY